MRRLLLILLFCLPVGLFAQGSSVPVIPFDSVPNFLKLPVNMYLGEASGVAVNSKGHVFVLTRANTSGPAYGAAATQLLEFAPDGKFLREIGRIHEKPEKRRGKIILETTAFDQNDDVRFQDEAENTSDENRMNLRDMQPFMFGDVP